MTAHGSVLELIGNTPLVDISQLSPNPDVRILIKLEGQNPGGSVKDRIALSMIEEAEKDGILETGPDTDRALVGQHRHRDGSDLPDQGVPPQGGAGRPTSRSSAASSSRSGGLRSSSPRDRRAPTVRSGGPRRWPTTIPSGRSSTSTPIPANPKAHYEGTGPEIWRDCPEVTHFVAGLGTSRDAARAWAAT